MPISPDEYDRYDPETDELPLGEEGLCPFCGTLGTPIGDQVLHCEYCDAYFDDEDTFEPFERSSFQKTRLSKNPYREDDD